MRTIYYVNVTFTDNTKKTITFASKAKALNAIKHLKQSLICQEITINKLTSLR